MLFAFVRGVKMIETCLYTSDARIKTREIVVNQYRVEVYGPIHLKRRHTIRLRLQCLCNAKKHKININ